MREHIAVIDTETTWSGAVMTVGIVIADASNYEIVGYKYYVIKDCLLYTSCSVATKTSYVEILNFRHFFKHIVFTSEKDKIRNKEIKNYVNVSVVVDIECGNAKLEAL